MIYTTISQNDFMSLLDSKSQGCATRGLNIMCYKCYGKCILEMT